VPGGEELHLTEVLPLKLWAVCSQSLMIWTLIPILFIGFNIDTHPWGKFWKVWLLIVAKDACIYLFTSITQP
jgi:hypothetical protein